MTKYFSWNPVHDQIFDGEYNDQTLTTEDRVDDYSIYTFNKVNSNFSMSALGNTTLNLNVNKDAVNVKNHIYWSSNVYGKVINIITGRLWCNGSYGGKKYNAVIESYRPNYLSFNVSSIFLMRNYNNILFQNVYMNANSSGSLLITGNNNVVFSGDGGDINIYDNFSYQINYSNRIHIENVNFNINIKGDSHIGFELNASIIEFFSYDKDGNRGIKLNNISYGNIYSPRISLNDAKIYINDNAILRFSTDNLVVTSGGRFTISSNGQMNASGLVNNSLGFSGSDLSSYPKGLFSFNAPNGAINGFFTFDGWTTGKELSDLFMYELISVNGNTDETYLRSVLNFEDANSGLKISMNNN
ncbi:hypothetical protein [Pseudochrobactrum saccharolyticum]|uniref:hypothetical protein n=1 Tax=Pseudochrobactrum saccharolyticum TaxID=354352 RepID=UPI002749D0E0|nr:hypothetical protein [Pseudochrobactrum saccharolyticum]MDP8252038.1 hypothetical protein [Pseudochrobactrum saccharolyticum]